MVVVAPSVIDTNLFFIFRDKGVEVKVRIIDKALIPSHHLTPEEVAYFDLNIIGIVKNQVFLSKI